MIFPSHPTRGKLLWGDERFSVLSVRVSRWSQFCFNTERGISFVGRRRKFVYSFSFQVSWVRHRDIHLLTVGRYTYTSDQRFEALHLPHAEEWTLRIRYPQKKDSGIYECQISTTPPIGHPVYLTIVGKEDFRWKTLSFPELRKSFFSKEGGPSSIQLWRNELVGLVNRWSLIWK